MTYSEYNDYMSYENYKQMDDEANSCIIDVVGKLYNMGCWFSHMSLMPPNIVSVSP